MVVLVNKAMRAEKRQEGCEGRLLRSRTSSGREEKPLLRLRVSGCPQPQDGASVGIYTGRRLESPHWPLKR